MRKRPWLVWLILLILFALGGTALWIKLVVEEQPAVHEDPGVPIVPDLPDPEDVE